MGLPELGLALLAPGLVHHHPLVAQNLPVDAVAHVGGEQNVEDMAVPPPPLNLVIHHLALVFHNALVPPPVLGPQIDIRGQIQTEELLLVLVAQNLEQGRVHVQKPPLLAGDKGPAAHMGEQSLVIGQRGFELGLLGLGGGDVLVDGELGPAAVPVFHGHFRHNETFVQILEVNFGAVGLPPVEDLAVAAPAAGLVPPREHLVTLLTHPVAEQLGHEPVHIGHGVIFVNDVDAVGKGIQGVQQIGGGRFHGQLLSGVGKR